LIQHPAWRPVGTAHVSGEKRDVQTKLIIRRDVADLRQMIEALRGNGVWCGLKIVPQQEQPHNVQAKFTNKREFLAYFSGIEIRPPIHRFPSGPIIHTKYERFGQATAPSDFSSYK